MIREIRVKSVLNRHKRRDEWFLDDYSVNPYTGCSFNCLYCYVRGSRYGKIGLAAKVNAPEVLERELKRRARRGEYGIIALSTSTEPYMDLERKLGLTRRVLQVILRYRFPVHVLTKSVEVLRDLDLLKEIEEKAVKVAGIGAVVSFSLSTLDAKVSKLLEPGAPKPESRLEAMSRLREAGLRSGACFIPVLPFISDSEGDLDEMVRAAREHGADYVLFGALTLFGNGPADSKTLYYGFLERNYPELLPKYRALFRNSFQPPKLYQLRLEESAKKACAKYRVKYGLSSWS